MEVATSNNHSHQNHHHHNHHRHHHHLHATGAAATTPQQQPQRGSVVASGGGARSPFQREVREWQRIDPDTGALLTGRLEADRWINGPLNSYGKISDSQNISQPNGTQQTQRKQLEVLQARTANGAMQVIRAHTVQTTSSRWSSATSSPASSASPPMLPLNGISVGAAGSGGNGGGSLFHNHSHYLHPLPHLAETGTNGRWPSQLSTVDISELNVDGDDYHHTASAASSATAAAYAADDDVADETGEQQQHGLINGHSSNGGNYHYNNNHHKHSNNLASRLSSNLLLLDTAPSLKLSNLMKSNSSISSNNSSNSNNSTTTPATTKTGTHKSAAQVNLHAIAGSSQSHSNYSNGGTKSSSASPQPSPPTIMRAAGVAARTKTSTAAKTTAAATTTASWQQQTQQRSNSSRVFEQPALYGHSSNNSLSSGLSNSNNLNKSRVGVSNCEAAVVVGGDGGGGGFGDAATASAAFANDPHHQQQQQQHHHHQLQHQQPQQQQQRNELTPTQLSRQPRRDLESFRHYNDLGHGSELSSANGNDDDDDDDLRLTARHQRRQQHPLPTTPSPSLQLSRSISNDDLSTEWDQDGEANEQPGEWRRVSKLRRSFQSTTNASETSRTALLPRRPLDLPRSSVSVSRIRAELENGRRLNTAMRNNHVDLAALDSILNGPAELKPQTAKQRSTFLTAESLKEIRGKLKKLSDESLYKEDFLVHEQPPADEEHIEVPQMKRLLEPRQSQFETRQRQLASRRSQLDSRHSLLDARHSQLESRHSQLDPKQSQLEPKQSQLEPSSRHLSPEKESELLQPIRSAFHAVQSRQQSTSPAHSYMAQRTLSAAQKHTTNSLESRQKTRELATSEWHLRRKSYGFEKMSPPDDKSMFRMDASTDSGLGRSGELGNWSPTEGAPHTSRGIVVHFGEHSKLPSGGSQAQRRYRALKSPLDADAEETQKRHSIAVDECQYVRDNLRKTSQVHLNGGLYNTASMETNRTLLQTEQTQSSLLQRSTQQKRVEFCKTEVHFAAESGRVNIVETDGKPPPTNNFRRRRRTTSGPLQSLVKSAATISSSSTTTTTSSSSASSISSSVALPITHFGDDHRLKTIASSTVAYRASLLEEPELLSAAEAASNVTVSLPKSAAASAAETHASLLECSRNSYASTSGVDTTDGENDEISAIRGILKNKPVKPKPYHLGENIDSADALWGVQLKPLASGRLDSFPGVTDDTSTAKSVAERVRIVEKSQDQTNNYSTKINLSLGDTSPDWTDSELPKSNVMSIELHSPQATLRKPESLKLRASVSPPVAKPRSSTNASHTDHMDARTVQTMSHAITTTAAAKAEQLKIVKESRGARKLREHELSYFGVQVPKHQSADAAANATTIPITNTSKRSLPSSARKLSEDTAKTMLKSDKHTTATTKWQLINDKPDLLRHSPTAGELPRKAEVRPAGRQTLPESDEDELDFDEHFYENITTELTPTFKVKSPNRVAVNSYDRKMDLKRDAMILTEMTRNADQTLKALSDEAALKDQRRRSLQRRHSKPLETIDEKIITEKINDKCIAVKVTRSTLASEAKRSSRHSTPSPTAVPSRTRTSSQSSVESCSRARSRSLSSEHEYENINLKSGRTAASAGRTKSTKAAGSRSSSRESQRSSHTLCSSGDEASPRTEERRATKTKRISSSNTQLREKRSRELERSAKRQAGEAKEKPHRSSSQHRRHHSTEKGRSMHSSSTTHSSQRERTECPAAEATASHHHQRAVEASSSSRRRKDEHDAHKVTRSSADTTRTGSGGKHDKHERSSAHLSGSSGVRLLRSTRSHGEHEAAHRSSNRSERGEKDKEKEKLSRSKGHSSRSNMPSSSATPTKMREHKKATATKTTTSNSHSSQLETTTKSHDTMTHSKNAPQQQQQQQPAAPPAHIQHGLTTATIAAKQRERHGKDRK